MTHPDPLDRFIVPHWRETALPTLMEYIRIPNKSPAFDPDWEARGHMRHAAELLADWARTMPIDQLQVEIVSLPGRTPTLFLEISGTGAPGTVLLYGHYDKQPEFDGWSAGLAPFEPVLQNGRLYGRGGADDGYALFGSLLAIAALQAEGLPHARCVVLVEGCEESGSFDLPHYVDALARRIGTPDLVICLDAECGDYERLWVTSSLRGMLPGVLRVNVLDAGQHSGAAGGIVPSSFRLLRNLLERVEDAATGALHPALAVDIPDHVRRQAARAADILGPAIFERFPWAGRTGPWADGAQPAGTPTAVLSELVLNNTWRPSLAVVGLDGAPAIRDAGNTLRPGTAARLVFRLPPTLDAQQAGAALCKALEADPPHGAEVRFELDTPQTGWAAPEPAPWLAQAAASASRETFAADAAYMGMGGTIPFMKMLGDAYPGVQFFVTGVLGPHSNAHGPNEFLHLQTVERLIGCVARILRAHGQRPDQHG